MACDDVLACKHQLHRLHAGKPGMETDMLRSGELGGRDWRTPEGWQDGSSDCAGTLTILRQPMKMTGTSSAMQENVTQNTPSS